MIYLEHVLNVSDRNVPKLIRISGKYRVGKHPLSLFSIDTESNDNNKSTI